MAIPETVRKVVESGRLAHLVTLNRDGSPQVTCVWVGVEGDEIVVAHLAEHLKVKNVRRDGRVSFSIETDGVSPQGLNEYLIVHGVLALFADQIKHKVRLQWPTIIKAVQLEVLLIAYQICIGVFLFEVVIPLVDKFDEHFFF